MMNKREILLDDDAQRLFEQLGGIDTERRPSSEEKPFVLSDALLEEENRRDEWRSLLVEFVFLFSGFLASVRRAGLTPKHREDLDSLLMVLDKIAGLPGHDGVLMVRYHGTDFTRASTRAASSEMGGYTISLGFHTVNLSVSKAMANRRGVIFSHLPGRLSSAFSVLASLEIHTLHLALQNWEQTRERVRQSMEIMGCYFMVLAGTRKESQADPVPSVMRDENGQADPNLTLVAGLNSLQRKTLAELVAKIKGMMDKPGMEQFTSVYSALFAFKQIREKWAKPPLEVNNLRWLIADKEDEVLTKEKSLLVRAIIDRYAGSPSGAAQVLQGVYGSDFRHIEADLLEERLSRVGDFLEEIEKAEDDPGIKQEVLRNVEHRLDRVPDKIFEKMDLRGNTLVNRPVEGETITSRLNAKLVDLVSFFKRRTGTKQKIREMVRGSIDLDEQDYETIARDFMISVEEVKTLVGFLKDCFGQDGRFLRTAFEKHIPDFAQHQKVFAFLWHYLKEIAQRQDRVAYLNSLQALVSYMKNPYESMLFLLEDFLKSPEALEFSDRNTIMLASAFLQRHVGEHDYDSEMTPEEVLQQEDGLNLDLAARVAGHLEEEQEKFFLKVRTIHQTLAEKLFTERSTGPMSFRFLFSLEREVYIFLSLIGGSVAHMVIRSALGEYGDMGAEIYRAKESGRHVRELILLLQVLVRGAARFKEKGDLPLILKIREQEELFSKFTKNGSEEGSTRRLLGRVDAALRELKESRKG